MITALLALAVAVIVHGFLVPWRQARIRKQERWEDAVTELASLAHLTLSRLMTRYHAVAEAESYARSLKGQPQVNEDALNEMIRTDRELRRELDDEISDTVTRMNILTGRVTSARKDAIESVAFDAAQRHLMLMTKFVVSTARRDDEPRAERDGRWEEYQNARHKFVDKLTPFEERMRPPPSKPRRWVRAKWVAVRSRKRRDRKAGVADDATTAHDDGVR